MRAYEIHTFKEGVWRVDSVFDDRQLAMFEAKRVEEGSRYSGVKVVEEIYDEVSNLTTTRTLYRGGAAKTNKPKTAAPAPKAKRPNPRGGSGREPARKGGQRKRKKESNTLVLVLITLLILFGGLAGLLGLNYLSGLK